ncbi:MAG: MATE family efflux transporter [Dehalococcoidales bacterium]
MEIKNHNVLETDKIGRLLFKLTMPMFFGMLVQNIYNVVDTIFIGQYVGSEGIAALSIVFPIQMLTMGVGNMVGIGGGSLVSRLIGGSDHRRAERALGNSIGFSVIFGIILTLIVLPGVTYWLKLIGASDNVLPLARDYLTITFAGTIFNITNSVLLMLVRAEGNTRVAMVSLMLQSILNIILDAVFIIWLKMGVSGAALAMVICQAVSMTYVLTYYLTGNSYLKIRWRNFIPDMKIVKDIFAIGMTQLAQTVAMTVSSMIFIKMAINYGGDLALGAFGIIQRIMMFSSIPGMVLGQAMQPILGFNFGAKRYKLALKVIYLASIVTLGCGIFAFILLYAVTEPLIRIFTSDPQLIAETVIAVRYIFIVLPLFSLFNVGQLIFPSCGKVVESFIVAFSRPAFFLAPLILILPHFWQMTGVWFSFPGSDILSFVLVVALFIPLMKKFRKASALDAVSQVGH